MSTIPRRIQIDRLTPAENAIRLANEAVEALPADVRLTGAQILLSEARDLVADYVDGIPPVAEPPADVGVAQAEPSDAFGAHILSGVLGSIDGREIGAGHVVLSEQRYLWLQERVSAIDFALRELSDHYDMREFLEAFHNGGSLADWPEFAARQRSAAAKEQG